MGVHTDNEGNHAGAISAGGLETLDEFLDFPDFNVLFGFAALPLRSLGHGCLW